MTLGLSKSSLNIIRINDKQESKKRKLNELMSDHNINNNINSFDHQIHYQSYGSPSKRSRNAFDMTSIDSNIKSDKRSKSGNFVTHFISNIWEKFKFGKNENISKESQQFVRSNDNTICQMSSDINSGDSLQIFGSRNALNYSPNNTNFSNNNMSHELNSINQNISTQFNHQKRTFNENVNQFSSPYNQIFVNKNSETVLSKSLSSSANKTKSRSRLKSFRLEDRERYKILLNNHLSDPHINKVTTIASLNSKIKPKKHEVIDLSSSVSSSRSSSLMRNDFYESSRSRNTTDRGFTKENLDNKTKNNLVERIRSAGIVAQPFNKVNTTPFGIRSSYNQSLFSTRNNSLTQTPQLVKPIEKTQLPESCRKFNDLLNDKKNLLESQWVKELRDSLTQSEINIDNRISQSERKVLESKNKRQTDCENLKDLIRTPWTRSELSPFVPFCQFEDRLPDDVIEETEEDLFEEDSIAKDLPLLTPEMDKMIDEALRPTPPHQVLSEAFSITVTRKDMETLSGLNWLNDEVINFYMSLIVERSKNDNFSSAYAFNTFFYPKLREGGHQALKRWTRKVDIFSYDFIFIPIHLGMHWCLAVIDFLHKKIEYYDSMGGKNNECVQALRCYLQDESFDKKKKEFDMSDWTLDIVKDIPQQMNGSDCGMFTCKYAEYISRKAKINFSQAHMPYFRRRMVYEILTKKLL